MNWYYVDAAGQQVGPVDDATLEGLIASGAVNAETLAWREGLANWQPLREARPGQYAAAPAAAPVPAGAPIASGIEEAVCAECGGIFPVSDTIRIGSARVCANCKPVFVQKMREGVDVQSAGSLTYAGFWIRFAAVFLDGLILGAFNVALNMALLGASGMMGNTATTFGVMNIVVMLIQGGVALSYETFMIGKYGATLGKMACKIQVVVADGTKVSYARAVGRYFAKILNYFTCMIGFIIAGFDSEKRGLHDRICNTRVVYK